MGTSMERLYRVLPTGAQHLAVTAFGAYWRWFRFGPGFRQALDGFVAREWFGKARWESWTATRLQAVLRVAASEVPYYAETWSKSEKKAALCGDLRALPLLEKEPLRSDPVLFVRKNARRTVVHHTSGSTGTPIAVHWTVREYRAALALREARSARWAGVSFSLPRATFSGRLVEPDPESKGPYYRYNAVEKQVYFSAFHLGPRTAAMYVEAMERHGTRWLTGYAMSTYLLAKYILEQRIRAPCLDAVVTTSEKLTPGMRAVIEEAFGGRVFEEYSTVENVLFASECEKGRLHVSPDAGVVEILRADGTECEPGEIGEVVATCLLRDTQPFIRVRLGDLAAWAPEPCPCGRAMPVLEEVVGRVEDVVVGPDGREMVRFHGLYLGLPGVRCGQVVQEAVDRITVKVETAPGFSDAVAAEIVQRVRQRLGSSFHVQVEVVDRIPRGPNGKFRSVVSLVEGGSHAPVVTRGEPR